MQIEGKHWCPLLATAVVSLDTRFQTALSIFDIQALTIAELEAELEVRFAKQDAIPAENCPSTTDEGVEDFPQDNK